MKTSKELLAFIKIDSPALYSSSFCSFEFSFLEGVFFLTTHKIMKGRGEENVRAWRVESSPAALAKLEFL